MTDPEKGQGASLSISRYFKIPTTSRPPPQKKKEDKTISKNGSTKLFK